MKSERIEYIKLVELLSMLSILEELSRKSIPVDKFKELSFKNVLN